MSDLEPAINLEPAPQTEMPRLAEGLEAAASIPAQEVHMQTAGTEEVKSADQMATSFDQADVPITETAATVPEALAVQPTRFERLKSVARKGVGIAVEKSIELAQNPRVQEAAKRVGEAALTGAVIAVQSGDADTTKGIKGKLRVGARGAKVGAKMAATQIAREETADILGSK